MTDMETVKACYPRAAAWRGWGDDGLIAIWNGIRGLNDKLSGHFKTADEAWADARAFIEANTIDEEPK
jgi:hypothetical protein